MLNGFLDLMRSALSKGLFHLLSSNFIVQFLGFGLIVFLTKFLSPGEIGELKLIQSYAAFFIVLGTLGYNSTILKLCSENVSEQQKRQDFSYCVSRVFLASIVSVVLFILVAKLYVSVSNEALGRWMSFYAVVIIFSSLGYCFIAYLQSKKMIREVSRVQLLIRSFFVLIIFVCAFKWGFAGVIVATILSYLIGLIFYFPFISYSDLITPHEYARKKKLNKYAVFVFCGALITLVSQYGDIYLMAYLNVSSEDIGLYSIATVFFMAGTVIVGTIQSIATPYFSEKQNDLEWVRAKALYFQKVVSIASVFVSLSLVLLSWLLTKYYYGEGYELSFEISVILMTKFFFWGGYSLIGACLFAIGVIKEGVIIALIVAFLNVIFSYVLFGFFQIYGVALGQVLAAVLNFVFVYILFFWKTRRLVGEDFKG